jgi:hypothetical protein
MSSQMTVTVEKIDLATSAMDHDVALGRLMEAADRLPAGSRVEVALNGGVGGQSALSEILRGNPELADGSSEVAMVFEGAYPTHHMGSVDRTAFGVYADAVSPAPTTPAIRL